MTQLQFEMIWKIVESGAPALAMELNSALDELVRERNTLEVECERLRGSLETFDKDSTSDEE